MIRRLQMLVLLTSLAGAQAMAQEFNGELSAGAGYTLSDGVTFPAAPALGFNGVEPADAFSWSFTAGFHVTENTEVGGRWSRQQSSLVLLGPLQRRSFEGLNVDNLHVIFTYNQGDEDAPVRPYLYGGLGVTLYGSLQVDDVSVDGRSRFSSTWGAGVKIYPGGDRAGLELGVRWTPTYIRSDPGGVWCDPYWGCFTTSDAQFSNQFELGGGLTLRF